MVLDGCSAHFPSGQRTVLWGRSGTGKSTLLTAIAGLLVPQSGAIELGSRVFFSSADGIDLPPYDRRVGFVFQDLALWPHLSAIDHVCLVGRPTGLDRAGAQALLQSVGLGGLERGGPDNCRVANSSAWPLLRALAGRPSVLLLDEPFSSVDRKTKDSLYHLLREVAPRIPGPTIYVTHHADDAISLAETVMTLEAGRLALVERPWEDE